MMELHHQECLRKSEEKFTRLEMHQNIPGKHPSKAVPCRGKRPLVVLRPTMPQLWAGLRILPPLSEAIWSKKQIQFSGGATCIS